MNKGAPFGADSLTFFWKVCTPHKYIQVSTLDVLPWMNYPRKETPWI